MQVFPFIMRVSKLKILGSLAALGGLIACYLLFFKYFTFQILIAYAVLFSLLLVYFTENLISSVEVDVDRIIIDTLLKKEKKVMMNDIRSYKIFMKRFILIDKNGRHYILPSGLTHSRRFRDFLDYYLSPKGQKLHKSA